MKNRRVLALAAIFGTVIILGLSGCTQSSKPSTDITPTPTASSTVDTQALAQYWVADTSRGFRLYREFARVNPVPDAITAALRQLVSQKPSDSDYVSLWPQGTTINSVKVSGDLAIVDLTFPKLNLGSEAESLAIAQLVWTATAAVTTVKKISLTVDGKKIESLAGHMDATKPFSRGLTYEVLAPIWITSPAENQSVAAKGFTLNGMASTFEANVVWKVFKDGVLIQQGSTTALEAAPAWKPWSVSIENLKPGTYQFFAMEYSAKDGSLVAQDTKNVILK
ncbi:MAG: Gmad2 immunoglobulin-like domain-containing protein [Candidatus Planktophila sp.]|nr:Gmad2 immunoglobulin-like domain-containing protein [Candidatus Planktophila sp.]